ncbi:MAG: anhydro-N-acetylmuramic acid kinase [Phycisphaerales bacterium]
MTGTSLDGLDVALVCIDGAGADIKATLVDAASRSLGDLAPRLRALASNQPHAAIEFAAAARDLAIAHADAILALDGPTIDFAVCHGQTILHRPPLSWQILNPAVVAATIDRPVLSDLRAADLARGGQGAPITPMADAVLFRNAPADSVIVNLGGFCNISVLDAPERGGDVCACNHILDGVARRLLNARFDANGDAAASGRVRGDLVARIADALDGQAASGRSLGSGDECDDLLAALAAETTGPDLAASACRAIAERIARSTDGRPLVLAGGGARNRTLVAAIRDAAGGDVRLSDEFGAPVGHREAMGMAVLGALCQDGDSITIPDVTGRSPGPCVCGSWTGLEMRR